VEYLFKSVFQQFQTKNPVVTTGLSKDTASELGHSYFVLTHVRFKNGTTGKVEMLTFII